MADDNGLVSIITPTYNCGQYIEETILSVQAQTYGNWEMIIVDDCSTDNTEAIVTRYAAIDHRIRYIKNEHNMGAALTRNRALREARGRWIAFLDSDDLWAPTKLQEQTTFMIEHGYAFTYHRYTEIDDQSQPLGVMVNGIGRVKHWDMMLCNWLGCLTVMYDAQKVGLMQVANIRKNNDQALWLQVVQKTDCFLLPRTLARYRRRKGSITPSNTLGKLKWHYLLFRQGIGMSAPKAAMFLGLCVAGNARKKLFFVKRKRGL